MTLKLRLLVGMAVMLLPLVVGAFFSFAIFNQILSSFEMIAEEAIEEVAPLASLEDQLEDGVNALQKGLEHPEQFDQKAFEALRANVDAAYIRVLKSPFDREVERELVVKSLDDWKAASRDWKSLTDAGEVHFTSEQIDFILVRANQAVRSLEQFRSTALNEILDLRNQERNWRRSINIALPVILLLSVVIAGAIGYGLARAILKPVKALEKGAQHLADGELSYRVAELSHDELGDLARTFNTMAQRLEQSHQKLEGLSNIDFLTGLANVREFYRLFHDEIRRAERYGHAFSLLLMDVDRFKEVNDTHGHQIGDLVLQEVGRKLRELTRVSDHVARIGGDEFAVLLPETGLDPARELGERIRKFFSVHRISSEVTGTVDVSMGVSLGLGTFQIHAADANALFAAADRALYRAKNSGRNRLCLPEECLQPDPAGETGLGPGSPGAAVS